MTGNEVFSLFEKCFTWNISENGVRTYTKQANQNTYKIKVAENATEVYGFVSNPKMGTSSYVCPVELLLKHDAGWLMRKLREKLYDNCRYYDD